jgi:TRAP-type mannitol/chloroaromatic compound transport system permease small subunit
MVYISANPQVMQLFDLYFSFSPGNAVVQFIFQLLPRQCSYMVYISANPQAMQLYSLYFSLSPGNAVIWFIFQLIPR